MAEFTKTGTEQSDYWQRDGNSTFSTLPANTIAIIKVDLPIRLHIGNHTYGQIHIEKHWNYASAGKRTIPELIYYKLGQPGTIYCSENQNKFKIVMAVSPGGMLVLEHRYKLLNQSKEHYLSVTTFYANRAPVDGSKVGRYGGRPKSINSI